MDYRQLRAEYDAAFERLRRADRELRSIRQEATEENPAQRQFEQAMNDYRACRRRLATFLLSGQPAGSRTVGVWTIGTAPADGARQDEVQVLAHRLWEEAGRPLGRAEEHWYRAEKMLPNPLGRTAESLSSTPFVPNPGGVSEIRKRPRR